MARQSLVSNERFERFQTKLLGLCLARAGTWANLARSFPMSESHLYLMRAGKSKPGPEILCRMLEFTEILEPLEAFVDDKIAQMAEQAQNAG